MIKFDEFEQKQENIYNQSTYEKSESDILQDENETNNRETVYVYLCSLTAALLAFDNGCNLTWTSPAISTLRSIDYTINPLGTPVTVLQESYLAASLYLGSILGPLTFGKLPNVIGRAKLLIIISVLKIAAYIILVLAPNINLYYLGRFMLGVGMGLDYTVLSMYDDETLEHSTRGKFTALGIVYTLVAGRLLPLKLFTMSCTVPLVVGLIGFVFVMLTLLFFNFVTIKARRSLNSECIVDEGLVQFILIADENYSSKSVVVFKDICSTPTLRKALIICLGLHVLKTCSGISAILAFIVPIFETAGLNQIPMNFSMLAVSITLFVCSCVSSLAIEKFGRRILLLISTTGTTLSLLSLGLYFYLKQNESQYIHSIYWMPLASLVAYMVFFNIGLNYVPIAVLNDIFPLNVVPTASSIVIGFEALTAFVITFLFPIVAVYLGSVTCFWFFATVTTLGAVFIYFVVPETKGKCIH